MDLPSAPPVNAASGVAPSTRGVATSIDALRARSLASILHTAAQARRWELAAELYPRLQGVVQSGPFRGSRLPAESCWGDGDLGARLIGCYEEELWPAIERFLQWPVGGAVVIGCAEGYYAVGLAVRARHWRVLAFDTAAKAQSLCGQAAGNNGVADRVTVGGRCGPDELTAALSALGTAVVLCDCEGCEVELLDPGRVPRLASCPIIVECHDLLVPDSTRTLAGRFASTHSVEVVPQGARNPSGVAFMRMLPELDRWLLVCENRRCVMNWLVLTPIAKGVAAG